MANIGVFDSGVGGLWILKHLREELPGYNYVFFGDQAHVPYGERKLDEIKDFSERITNFLIGKGCKIIVIACNTASAAALHYLRQKFPDIIFVGMEPAVKPAVESTITGKVGVLATPATFQGELYNSVVERFAHDTEIFKDTCLGLVEQIEKGEFESEKTKEILRKAITPMLIEGIDTIVLGCTHYPFVIPAIREIVGNEIKIIDPTKAIVKRVAVLAEEHGVLGEKGDKKTEILTSSKKEDIIKITDKLFGDDVKVDEVVWGRDL